MLKDKSGLFLSLFPLKTCMHISMRAIVTAHNISDLKNVWWRVQFMKIMGMV